MEANVTQNVTKVTLGFPVFQTLHYDPTVSVDNATDLGYVYSDDSTEVGLVDILDNSTTSTTTTSTTQTGGAFAAHMGFHAVLGALVVLVMLV